MLIRHWRRKRSYDAKAPVFARESLTFLGRPVARGEQVPEEYFSSARHRARLWRFGKVSHAPRGVFADTAAASTPAPVAVQAATEPVTAGEGDSNPSGSYPLEPGATPGSATTMLHVSPSEHVSVETPKQAAQRRSKR